MGFLDKVICEYPLPLPEEVSNLEETPNWSELEFYTSSFNSARGGHLIDGFIEEYSVEEDGQIYMKDLERDFTETEQGFTVDEIDNGIIKVDYTGELAFGTTLLESEYDYHIEFIALIWKGELKEIKLKEWEKVSNAARLEAREKISAVVRKQTKNKDNRLVELIRLPFKYFFLIIKYALGLIIKCMWWLERQIL